jgi:hypothetical protein
MGPSAPSSIPCEGGREKYPRSSGRVCVDEEEDDDEDEPVVNAEIQVRASHKLNGFGVEKSCGPIDNRQYGRLTICVTWRGSDIPGD